MSAVRIQLRRTKGWRKPAGVVVVSRPSKWGNPFRPEGRIRNGVEFWVSIPFRNRLDLAKHHHTEAGALQECVDRFRVEAQRPSWAARIAELRGHDLACWCPLLAPCHADVLLELANPPAAEPGTHPREATPVIDRDDVQKIRALGETLVEDHEWEALGMDLRQALADSDTPCGEQAERELRDHMVWLLS